jgi:hypothetical protein
LKPEKTGLGSGVIMTVSERSEGDEAVSPRRCRLLRPLRDHQGVIRYGEQPTLVREVSNLGRRMYLVRFDDGTSTFVFPDEIAFE